MSNRVTKVIRGLIAIFLVMGIFLMVGTVTRLAAYTVFVSDDFWHAQHAGIVQGTIIERIKAAWDYNKYMYFNHQGAYSLFFLALFNPVTSSGFSGLRVIMVLNSIVFFSSLFFLVYCMYIAIVKKVDYVVLSVMMFCLVFVMTQYDSFAETFLWYTGATNYSMPVSAMNIALAITLLQRDSKVLTVIAGILGIVAAGGVLPIGGALCYGLVLIIVYRIVVTKQINKQALAIFVVSFLGTLLNFLAPGYRIRQGKESTEASSLINSLGFTFKVTKDILKELVVYKNYLLVILTLLVCGAFIAKEVKNTKRALRVYTLVSVLATGIIFVTVFPVVYGYNVPWMPNRCVFVTVFVIDMVLGNLALLLGMIVWSKIAERKPLRYSAIAIAAIAFAVLFFTTDYPPTEYKVAKINKKLYDGDYQEYYYETKELMEGLKNHKGEDVVIDVATYNDEIRDYYCFFLVEKDNTQVNQCVAWTYGLNSISNSRLNQ